MRCLFDKVWDEHEIADLGDDVKLLGVDRHMIHDLVAGPALDELARRRLPVRSPMRAFAMPDHGVTSRMDRPAGLNRPALLLLDAMRQRTREAGIRMFDIGHDNQGIVHVVGPEMGLTLPGSLIVCGDSHTCTHGGLGALSFGIGTSEVVHVLATQTIRQRKPNCMRIILTGTPRATTSVKDLILYTIGRLGTKTGQGYAVEFAGPVVRRLEIEERLTLCNLSIELGAKIGMIAPDERTFEYLVDRPFTPRGLLFKQAVDYWRTLPSDDDAVFDAEHEIDITGVGPQISWGTSPQDVVSIDQPIPDVAADSDAGSRRRHGDALAYMDLRPGQPVRGVPITHVFIGSCANGRLSDLRSAAAIAARGKVAAHVRAWVVPGSAQVKRAAEAEGLHHIFRDAGFEWREPGCSLCLATANEQLSANDRCVSTTNRNFVGRQGPGARTHLASPATAAASALAGCISDAPSILSAVA